jgi:ABC-type oligopeptide transport system substrate-binding subunit
VRHLIPPGVIGGLPADQIGMGYNPDYARQQMAASGFSNCRLMPAITFMVSSSDLSLLQAEIMRRMWVEELDCEEDQIIIEQVPFGTLLANTRVGAGGARPDMWELGWASYYPDAHNWVGDLLHCTDSENRQKRACSEVDDLIRQAVNGNDFSTRAGQYREIENLFFGENGIVPIAPLYIRGNHVLVHRWTSFTPAPFGGEQFNRYLIDNERKLLELSR